jgi:SPP1 family predicted phage head-tail adaptor
VDAGGGRVRAWTSGDTVWANVAALSGGEQYRAQQVQADAQVRVTIRYRTGVTAASHRLLYGSRILKILAVLDPEERHERLDLYCAEER